MKNTFSLISVLALIILASCGGGSGGSYHSSPYITSHGFVQALNDVDGYYDNELVKHELDTFRTYTDSEDWFVIWDAEWGSYVAVSLQYIRAIEYYDFYASNYGTAEEFRFIQDDDYFYTGYIGDGYGNDYEEVSYIGGNTYRGLDTGYLYEEGEESLDVSLMAKEDEEKEFFQKASNVSVAYNMSIKMSLTLVTIGAKVEKMLDKNSGEMTEADQQVLSNDIQKVAGFSLAELSEATKNEEKKEQVLEQLAKKMETSTESLESKILPELFGIEI